jgi:hypothetical protein
MQLKHIAAVMGLSLISTYALAGSVADTTICTPVNQAMKGTSLNLPKGSQPLYGIRNISTQPVQLSAVNKTGTAQAGWDSRLNANHWSALTLTHKPLTFTCMQGKKTVPCNSVITVCQFRQAEFTEKAGGSYWVAENVTGSDIIAALAKRGIDADG